MELPACDAVAVKVISDPGANTELTAGLVILTVADPLTKTTVCSDLPVRLRLSVAIAPRMWPPIGVLGFEIE